MFKLFFFWATQITTEIVYYILTIRFTFSGTSGLFTPKMYVWKLCITLQKFDSKTYRKLFLKSQDDNGLVHFWKNFIHK